MLALNKLYNMDCLEGIAKFPDKYFDLAVVDPPYGISGVSNESWEQATNNPRGKKAKHTFVGAGKLKNRTLNECGKKVEAWDIAPPKEYFDELFRISKSQIIWGGNYFPLPPSRCWLCWDKEQPFENFSAFELAWTSFDSPAALYRNRVTTCMRGDEKIHPTQKPVSLYSWILSKYAKPGYKVLDTHAGSASSLIACHRAQLDFVGFELDGDYFEKATQRLRREMSQLTIVDIENVLKKRSVLI